jgi:hypothetical protein
VEQLGLPGEISIEKGSTAMIEAPRDFRRAKIFKLG